MIYRHSHTYIHLETVFFAGEDEKEEYFFFSTLQILEFLKSKL